jgi:predicted HicB family RNase H-like nuclease
MRAKPTVSLSVRLPPKVREAAERAAADSQKSLRDFVEEVLTEATERRREPAT